MRTIKNEQASIGLVVAAVSIIIIVAAGFLIYYNIGGQLSNVPAAKTQASTLNNTTNFVLGTLAPIGAIILIASATIVAVVALDKR